MRIGKLRHRVKLQVYTATRDSFGGEVEAWTDIAELWASIEPISGKEYFASQQINAEVNTKIVIRYKAGVNPKMRIKFGDRFFEIVSVICIQEKRKEIHLMCKENIDGLSES